MLRTLLHRNAYLKFQECSTGTRPRHFTVNYVKHLPQSTRFLSLSASSSGPATRPKAGAATTPVFHYDTEYVHFMLKGKIHSIANPQQEKRAGENHPYWDNPDKYSIYLPEDLSVVQTHHAPAGGRDRAALVWMGVVRMVMNILSRYKGTDQMTKDNWLDRIIFLETIAGCHGMIASMARHLRSLRYMTRDYGWISSLLEESENERLHLLIMLDMKKPSLFYRAKLGIGQAIYFNAFFLLYFLSPITAHRYVGYFHEEAIDSYTKLLSDLKSGKKVVSWGKEPAPNFGSTYYKLKSGATVYDIIENIRADEANHRDVNHGFASDPIVDAESILSKK